MVSATLLYERSEFHVLPCGFCRRGLYLWCDLNFSLEIGSTLCGAWARGRTGDPSLFRGMLYQLSYPSMLPTKTATQACYLPKQLPKHVTYQNSYPSVFINYRGKVPTIVSPSYIPKQLFWQRTTMTTLEFRNGVPQILNTFNTRHERLICRGENVNIRLKKIV